MTPIACRGLDRDELTKRGITSVISYWPISQKANRHSAVICLGENLAEATKCFDLYYSFKLLCHAEYGGTRQLHFTAKNYMRNYAATTGQYQPWWIPYKQALRNLTVLMFSHYLNNLENTGALEGYRTLMVHECLMVAFSLGQLH